MSDLGRVELAAAAMFAELERRRARWFRGKDGRVVVVTRAEQDAAAGGHNEAGDRTSCNTPEFRRDAAAWIAANPRAARRFRL